MRGWRNAPVPVARPLRDRHDHHKYRNSRQLSQRSIWGPVMSVRIMSQVWELSKHGGTELLALLSIADFAGEDGRAYPAVGTIAKKCRITSRHVNRILLALYKSGELEIRHNAGPRGTNYYRILVKGMTCASPLTPESPLTPMSFTPDMEVPKPLTPMSEEPSLNHQEPSCAKSQPDGFDVFYKAYPRKVSKQAAKKAFKAVKANQVLADLLKDIERRLRSGEWAMDKIQFIPYPTTYLNGRRWEDEPTVAPLTAESAWEGAR